MAGFTVTTADVQSYADLLAGPTPGNQHEATVDAGRYLARCATLPEDTADSLFARLSAHHAEIYDAVRHGLRNASDAVGGSARALLSVSRAYQDTENSISRQIDATVPPPRNGRPDYPYGGPTGFTGLPDPAAQLTTPDVPPDYPDPLEPVENVLDWVSRSEIVKQVVTHALGWDPYERYAQAFAGDWRAFARAGMAFGAVGRCEYQVAQNMGSGNQALGRTWQGNAADAAFVYFNGLADDVSEFAFALDKLDHAYRELADSAFAASKGIADLLHDLTDDVLTIIIVFATGGTVEVASKLLHILPEFAARFLERLTSAWSIAELLTGMARELEAAADIRDAAGYVYGDPLNEGAYAAPKQLVPGGPS